METKDKSLNSLLDVSPNSGLNIDVKRVFHRAASYWYLIIFSLVISLSLAFLNNRYSKRVYPVTASLIVKEADNISGAELLYNNSLLNFKRNYLNELYILKSYPLMTRVIEDLNFDVSFWQEGNILTTELYGDLHVSSIPVREASTSSCEFIMNIVSPVEFELSPLDAGGKGVTERFRFNDTITFGGYTGVFYFKGLRSNGVDMEQSLIFRYTPAAILAGSYLNRFNAEWAEQGAGVINLSLVGSNPRKEADLMAGLMRRYQESDLEIKNEAATKTVDFISAQLNSISDSLRHVELQLERFKNKNVVTDLGGEALRLYEKIEDLEVQKAQLLINKNYYKYLVDYINSNQDYSQIILPSSIGISDQLLGSLISKMNDLQLDLRGIRKSDNPLVEDAVQRVNQMKRDIIEAVRNQESTDNIKLQFINKQISDLEKQLKVVPIAERTLISIQRNYGLLENLYIFLLQKRSEAAISKASSTSDIVVVNPPKVGDPISPRTKVNYLLAVVAGLALPFGFFVLLEVFDNKIQSKEDIERHSTIPFLGGVGHKRTDSNLAVFNEPKSALAESFRALRSNLTYFLGEKGRGVFLITSSLSGEGKSFTSINLAAVLSLSGNKTLIVGADMRKPKIFGDFGLLNDTGISTYLAGLDAFDNVVQRTSFDNLDFISGGPIPPNPSELLMSKRVAEFIAEAKERYDFVVIDTPPLAVVTDAFILAPYADHVVFLVRQNYTPKELLKPVEDYYVTGRLRNLSVVLNDIRRSGYGYGYGYSYGYTYGYGYYGRRGRKNGDGYYQ